MKRLGVILLVLFAAAAFGASLSLSLLNLTTIGISDGKLDYFPIMYLTFRPFEFLSLKVTDYLALSHEKWTLGDYTIFQPRYYYAEVQFPLFNNDFTFDVLKSRLKETLTEKMDGLRVGGLKFDYYGLGGRLKGKWFEFGGAFDVQEKVGAVYGQISFDHIDLGTYYENRYNQISLDANLNLKVANLNNDLWAAVAAKTSTFNDPSFLAGIRSRFGDFEASFQYLRIGANRYDADFQTGDPNEVNEHSWAIYGELGYHLEDYYGAIFFKHNSRWESGDLVPLYGLKLSYKDISLTIANGDLHSEISGEQKILLEWNYFYSQDFKMLSPVKAKKHVTTQPKEAETFDRIADVYVLPLGSHFKIKGIVTSPRDLLGKGSMYIQDETGGVMVYGYSIPEDLQIGEVVVVQGTSKLWYGITEIVADSVEKVGTAQPVVVHLKSLSRDQLSNLVMVEGRVVGKGQYDFMVDTGTFKIKVYIKKGTNISLSAVKEGAKVRVTGILSLYQNELEILPRMQSDILVL